LLALLLTAALVAGCSKVKRDTASVKTESSAVTASSTAASPTPTPSATPRRTAKVAPSLGGTCDDLLPLNTIDTALGRPVIGKTAFIVGIAEPNIGRLTYLNCRYGLAAPARGKPAVAMVEIGISLYNSSAQATRRVQGTIEDFGSHGATPNDATVGQLPATILLGYSYPTLVLAAGARTVAVTVVPALVGTGRDKALAALAKIAVDATAKFTGPGAAPSASASTTN